MRAMTMARLSAFPVVAVEIQELRGGGKERRRGGESREGAGSEQGVRGKRWAIDSDEREEREGGREGKRGRERQERDRERCSQGNNRRSVKRAGHEHHRDVSASSVERRDGDDVGDEGDEERADDVEVSLLGLVRMETVAEDDDDAEEVGRRGEAVGDVSRVAEGRDDGGEEVGDGSGAGRGETRGRGRGAGARERGQTRCQLGIEMAREGEDEKTRGREDKGKRREGDKRRTRKSRRGYRAASTS
jgi:hypothetical protein